VFFLFINIFSLLIGLAEGSEPALDGSASLGLSSGFSLGLSSFFVVKFIYKFRKDQS
jgi:hypothetical protein